MRLPKAVTVFFSAVLEVLSLSFSIAVPLLFCPVCYFQINALELP